MVGAVILREQRPRGMSGSKETVATVEILCAFRDISDTGPQRFIFRP